MTIMHAGFDLGRIGTLSIGLEDASGPQTVSLTSGTYCHVDISSVMGSGLYVDLAGDLQAAIIAHASLQNDYTVTFDASALTYTIAKAAGTFNLTAPTGVARNVLGRTTSASSASSITSNMTPWYTILASSSSPTISQDPHDIYEPDGLVEGGFTLGGAIFGVSVRADAGIRHRDFTIPHQTQAVTFAHAVSQSVEWTWQALYEHARSTEPLLLVDDENTVLKLRHDAATFKFSRVRADWDGRWDVKMQCFQLGVL